jgi:uncharacterized cupredoxin-like copper-binding protein
MIAAADAVEAALGVVAVLAALTAVIKSGHWVYSTMKRIDDALTYVQHEMHFNGGSTMRDAVSRANRRLHRIEDALDIPHPEEEPPDEDHDDWHHPTD